MKADEVRHALDRRYRTLSDDPMGHEWSLLPEFSLAPGGGRQRIDLLCIRNWRGKPAGHERHAIEIKVTRSDLRAELRDPSKRAPFEAVTHRFYFATPAGLMTKAEVPDGCGLIEIHADGRQTREQVKAPRREPDDLPASAVIEAFRRASRAEHRLRHEESPEAIAARLNLEVTRLEGQVRRARHATDREAQRTARAMELVMEAVDGDLRCVCGQPVHRARGRRWEWRHTDGSQHVRLLGGQEYPSDSAELDVERLRGQLHLPGPIDPYEG